MDTITDESKAAKSRIFHEIIMQRLDWQMQNASAVDEKIGAWFQSAPVVITLLIGILGVVRNGFNAAAGVLAGIGVGLFIFSLAFFFTAQNPRVYDTGLNWQDINDDVANEAYDVGAFHHRYAYYVARDTLPANEYEIVHKITLFRWAAAIFALSVAFLLIAALICVIRAH